jgi:hypothetical protein
MASWFLQLLPAPLPGYLGCLPERGRPPSGSASIHPFDCFVLASKVRCQGSAQTAAASCCRIALARSEGSAAAPEAVVKAPSRKGCSNLSFSAEIWPGRLQEWHRSLAFGYCFADSPRASRYTQTTCRHSRAAPAFDFQEATRKRLNPRCSSKDRSFGLSRAPERERQLIIERQAGAGPHYRCGPAIRPAHEDAGITAPRRHV